MKYLYFDCFAGFAPAMAAGALLDMQSDEKLLNKISSAFPELALTIGEVKRCSMEAIVVEHSVSQSGKRVKKDELIACADRLDVSLNTKSQLESYVTVKAEAGAINPEDTEFDYDAELPDLICAAYVFETMGSLKVCKVNVSNVLYSDAAMLSGSQFLPVTKSETMYICKKYKIPVSPSPIEYELISENGAALLAVLGAAQCSSNPGNIIKIGYGAGSRDFDAVPNLVRAVYGEDDGGDMLFEAECAFENVFAEYAAMEG